MRLILTLTRSGRRLATFETGEAPRYGLESFRDDIEKAIPLELDDPSFMAAVVEEFEGSAEISVKVEP